ncbi:MAG: SUMF1/EgtB/PvdO family nonheme iron enzyme [Prevotellaceae bacterium]|jgi:gliding motility-associated lipoprotein GldJ|nr:SUMF1/EgtB/PvdO family nonheme iron enzyme [Prevotellaceae bacterium]
MKFSVQTLVIAGGVVAMSVAFAGCGGSTGAAHYAAGGSKSTGWNYNDPTYGAFEVREMLEQPTGPGLVFVPGGTFMMGRVAQELPNKWNNPPRRVNVDSYYLDQTEVRNVDYREYLHWLTIVYTSYPEALRTALPDTLVWRKPLGYYEMQVEFYFRLPAYAEYPVVGVSWLQAMDYCTWRTDRVNELALVRAGVLEFNVLEH